ncbi:MAG: glycosyltransferase [Myxococcales bacterium]
MRIAQFIRALYLGGTEVQLAELLRGLGSRHELKLGMLLAQGPLLPKVRALGLEPSLFPMGAVARPNTAVQILRVADWLRRERVDVVHVHDFSATLIAAPAALLSGTRLVVSRLDLAHYHSRAQRAVLSALTRAADLVVGNAEAIRRMLIDEERVDPARVVVIHNGLDLPAFDARAERPLEAPLPVSPGAPVLVHVANMNHEVKRQEDLFEALALLGPASGLQTLLVGDGPRRPMLEAMCDKLGLRDRVFFLGHRTDVPAIYRRATAGVLCSTAEGLSNAVMEGMASALPMVVTDVGGNPDLVAHLERGLVVPPRQPRALAEALRRVLGDPAGAAKMGKRAREFVESELTLERMVKAHEAAYIAAASRAAAPPPVAMPSTA